MKKFRQEFSYWDDDHTKLIRESKPPEFLDPEYYVKAHFHRFGGKDYFLNNRCRRLMEKHGLFSDRYKDAEELVGARGDDPCYIVCPGPSLKEVDVESLKGTALAVNSAGFLFDPDYWVMAESAYARWMIGKDGPDEIPEGLDVVCTARVAVCFRDWEIRQKRKQFTSVYVARWEEEFVVPPRVPAVSVFNALVTAWQMDFEEVILLGLDLSKTDGPYVEGVPYTKEGAANPFLDQIQALSQFRLPGFRVVNGSPKSKDSLPFDYVSYKELGVGR